MSAAAAGAWRQFYDHVEGQCGPNQDLRPVRDFAAKAAEHAARIAGVITIVEDVHATEIGIAAMASALKLADWYLNEAVRLQQAAQTDPKLLRAKLLLDWMQARRLPVSDFRDIVRLGPGPVRTKAAAEDALTILASHGWIIEEAGRPRRVRLMTEKASA